MSKRWTVIACLMAVICLFTACKDDVSYTGQSVLEPEDHIIVLADTFAFRSTIDSCNAIISQADSFLLGEIETDYGLLQASIMTQLACPEGYHYPEGFSVDSVDSICLFMYYNSWEGDAYAPLSVDAYMMDKKTFDYSGTYPTDLDIDDYFTDPDNKKSILANRKVVVAAEKQDSTQNYNGDYVPLVRMRVNDDFMRYFASIQSFESQESFNRLFKGLYIKTSFGSSTILNVTDIALGVYYHFSYQKAGKDTVVQDMKAFYANAEVRTLNHLQYVDKPQLIENLKKDSDTYNYIIAPAGVYTRLQFPMAQIADTIMQHMEVAIDESISLVKRPYVNKAYVKVDVENVFNGTAGEITRNDWLQPASYMLLIKEQSMERFFRNRELPTDTCAILSALTQGTDSEGNSVYYYSYDLSSFLTNQLRQESNDPTLDMLLVPVTVQTSATSYSSTTVSSVRQQQTMSATKIRSANNGMQLEIIYSGF